MLYFRSVYNDDGSEEDGSLEDYHRQYLSDADSEGPAEDPNGDLEGSMDYSANFDLPEISSDEEDAAKKKQRPRHITSKADDDDESVNSDDLMAFFSDSNRDSDEEEFDGSKGKTRGRRQSLKEKVDAILSPRVKTHAHVVKVEEERSTARKLSVLDTDVGDFRSALIDALSSKPEKRVVVKKSPLKLPDRHAVVVKKNEFHSNLQHSEHVVRKQLATALKKIHFQSRQNELLLRRLDNSESIDSFERLRRQLEERERVIERLELDNKHLQSVQRAQEKMLLDASKDMHDDEADPETSALAEVRSLTARLSSMRGSLDDARLREKKITGKYEQLRKKYRRLNKKHAKLSTDHSLLTSREGSLYTITETAETVALDGESIFAASVDDTEARGGSHSLVEISVFEEEKSKWELEVKSIKKNAASQKSMFLSEIALLKSDLQKSEKLKQDALEELAMREKQARVQVTYYAHNVVFLI